MQKKIVYIILFLFSALYVTAQNKNYSHYSSWNAIMVNAHMNQKLLFKSEVNFRRTNFLADWQQIVLRPYIQYDINSLIRVGVGYTYTQNYSFSYFSTPIDNIEHNLWQQFFLKQAFQDFTIWHRFRFEERFKDVIRSSNGNFYIDGKEYSNRLRYRFIIDIPLIDKPIVSAILYYELFLDFKQEWHPQSLDQNWIFIGFNIQVDEHVTIKSGYHISNTTRSEKNITNHILDTALIFRL